MNIEYTELEKYIPNLYEHLLKNSIEHNLNDYFSVSKYIENYLSDADEIREIYSDYLFVLITNIENKIGLLHPKSNTDDYFDIHNWWVDWASLNKDEQKNIILLCDNLNEFAEKAKQKYNEEKNKKLREIKESIFPSDLLGYIMDHPIINNYPITQEIEWIRDEKNHSLINDCIKKYYNSCFQEI